jgi:DDE superfamily endonuclease
MEDVLAVSTRPYDPRRPQVCLDETSRQLLAQVTPPHPVAPGQPAREDDEYERRGVCNLFLVCEPLAGWRHVMVSQRRTRIDWAHWVKELVDVHSPDAEQIVLVQDNLEHPHARVAVRRCTRRSSRPRPSGWPTGWSCTTRPSTAAG